MGSHTKPIVLQSTIFKWFDDDAYRFRLLILRHRLFLLKIEIEGLPGTPAARSHQETSH
jgi:hypothetical protein